MKFIIIPLTFLCSLSLAQDYIIEAEDGTLMGTNYIQTDVVGYTGTGAIGQFTTDGDRLDVNVNITESGVYQLDTRYYSSYKEQDFYVNDVFVSKLIFEEVSTFSIASHGAIFLDAGQNKLSIVKNWGWVTIDNIQLTKIEREPHDYSLVDQQVIDPNITPKAKSVYDYLLDNYGSKVISGQIAGFDELSAITTQPPLIKGWEFQHYTNGYAYLWDDDIQRQTFGWHDAGVVEEIIEWYNESNSCGMVSIQWHWHAPNGIGSSVGTNSFMTENTTFDISQAIVPSHSEHKYLLEDIDSIATQLTKLQDAGIPVLWRPLHEAGGEWFWWGAKGPETCKKLWDLVYDRIVNYHSIHNLIWIWSTPEAEWYVGNDKCDMVGYDSYPGNFNYTAQSVVFHDLYEITKGEKLIALTENGPLPDIDLMKEQDAMWSFFATWDNHIVNGNSTSHVQATYSHEDVITLENAPCSLITSNSIVSLKHNPSNLYPNPTQGMVFFNETQFYTVCDILGAELLQGDSKSVDLSELKGGVYLLVTNSKTFRVIKE